MSTIFISYSRKDGAVANQVKSRLFEQGHRSVFLDVDPVHGIPAGRNWEWDLYAQLRNSQAVVVLCSEHSMAAQWSFAEIVYARAMKKQLFPIKVAPCTILPLLDDLQIVDLTADPEEGYRRLWLGLEKAGLDPSRAFEWDGRRPPFPGLAPFEEEDAAVFFGREPEVRKAIEALNHSRNVPEPRLFVVWGGSGSGKSSLVQAGVLPRLRRDPERWIVLEPFRPPG